MRIGSPIYVAAGGLMKAIDTIALRLTGDHEYFGASAAPSRGVCKTAIWQFLMDTAQGSLDGRSHLHEIELPRLLKPPHFQNVTEIIRLEINVLEASPCAS